MIRPWPTVSSKLVGDFRIFKIRTDRRVSPRTGREHDFYVLDSPHWVNVIALTPDRQLVMIEQFRHGTNTVELEIPGGMIDASDDSPVAAGVRELREETGFEGEGARILGEIFANPAFLTNTCYTVIVQNCGLRHEQAWDQGEDIVTRLVPIASIPELMSTGKIRHSLVAVALYHLDLWLRRQDGGQNPSPQKPAQSAEDF